MYVCGWDGGGTKTEVCVSGMAPRFFGPLNPNGAPVDTVRATVRDALAYMAGLPGGLSGCRALVIGCAGVSNRETSALLEGCLRNGGYTGPLRLLGDQEIALAGAVDGPGAVLIAGTGAVCFGKDLHGQSFRVGGYGYLIDDEGSGYAIGRDLLVAAVRSADGRIAPTPLRERVLAAIGAADENGLVTWLYAPGREKKEIAALARLLPPAVEAGDSAALRIAEKAAQELADLVLTGWKKTGMTGGELALTGSILTHHALIRERVIALVHDALPDISIHDPRGTSAQGAARLAELLAEETAAEPR